MKSTDSIRSRIDALSPAAKHWLHKVAQQLNDPDADGYIDSPAERKECVAAGVIDQLPKGQIELPAEANDLLYSQSYLIAHH